VNDVPLRTLEVNGLRMRVAELGASDAPPVVLLHGFPELWYSWRHQLPVLAEAGYRAIAPDLRGFGGTTAPPEIEAYDAVHLTGDVTGLLDALGLDRAVVVGHDWGSDLAWKVALMHPERVSAVAGLSVPFAPRAPGPPLEIMRRRAGDEFYIVWFQQPGVADEALARDVRRTLSTPEVWTADWAARSDEPRRPPFLSEEDLDYYAAEFERTGFTGGLNWYRNIDRNWHLLEPYAERRIEQPAMFLTGSRDPVRLFMRDSAMDGWVTDLRERVVVEGAGHWVQQQCPDEVNAALLRFLRDAARAG
jgi:epoxide hydrolase A/B